MLVFQILWRTKTKCKYFSRCIYAHIFTLLRYSEEEVAIFHAIMRLERGFEKVVEACASDTDVFLALIRLVSHYMRAISTLLAHPSFLDF